MAGTQIESSQTLSYHGGNLDAARRLFPHAPLPWIDLSTGINACPYPIGEISVEAWTRLPEAAHISALEALAATAFGLRAGEVVAAPGTQSLIQLLPRLMAAKFVGILGFTYGEYARLWLRAEANVTHVETLEALADFDPAIVVNPNNPDGRYIPPGELAALAGRLAEKGGRLIVDEAFMDFYGTAASLAPELPENCVILRSFGKTYGLAGLRLGFILAKPTLAAAFRQALGPWAISGPAIEIATRAFADRNWLHSEAERLEQARQRLEALLQGAGFEIVGGTHLFTLARHPKAQHWFNRIAAAGILVRPFAEQPHWLRFGIPAPQDWPRLTKVLTPKT